MVTIQIKWKKSDSEKFRNKKSFYSRNLNHEFDLLCCPELTPQIAGEPLFPGELKTNESPVQSPMAPPV